MTIRDRKGQAAMMDLILVCISLSIFAVCIWTFSMSGKAPSSEGERSRQDYVKSMLLTTLYVTPVTDDLRYSSKSLSDLFCMHIKNPEEMPMEIVIAKMKEAKMGEALNEKVIGSEAEWFIYADPDQTSSNPGVRDLCIHGKGGSDVIEKCTPGSKVYAKVSTAASAYIAVPSDGSGNSNGAGPLLIRYPIFLGIKWS